MDRFTLGLLGALAMALSACGESPPAAAFSNLPGASGACDGGAVLDLRDPFEPNRIEGPTQVSLVTRQGARCVRLDSNQGLYFSGSPTAPLATVYAVASP